MFRQGDVLLKRIRTTKGECVGEKSRVLAEGETTGHKHVLQGDTEFFDDNGLVTVSVGQKGALLVHDEHAQISIPKGKYAVVLQREYSLIDGVRQVLD